ncbi:indole-3-glycerol phosphate synthase TrpC [Lactococcus nasutitermitis]|uniref:Indole-3-glycerol phosphate synthase n=1 Tax=Lactococcus nasutitermitis TaxID=1652957 RepID=A0ABV9JCS3_9LACT|nr:indole-3-glycerol phosphate synthase TrpC [Lactococcus nasutitermitis]
MNIKPGKFLETIMAEKAREVAEMADFGDFGKVRETYKLYDFLYENTAELQVIAECKKASPSLGDINTEVDLTAQAKSYEQAGAAMISVLTDPVFFKGEIDYLREISQAVTIPTLNKDFIIDEKQIRRAVWAGATVILLIVACFEGNENRLKELYDYAENLGLEILVETHNQAELDIAHGLGARIIGVNNRNLKTFEVDIQHSLDLAQSFKPENVYISESGMFGKQEAEVLAPYFNGILVGTALMQSENVEDALSQLKVTRHAK